MKTYNLFIVLNNDLRPVTLKAAGFDTSNAGAYYFYDSVTFPRKIVAAYPVDRTIIESIEDSE